MIGSVRKPLALIVLIYELYDASSCFSEALTTNAFAFRTAKGTDIRTRSRSTARFAIETPVAPALIDVIQSSSSSSSSSSSNTNPTFDNFDYEDHWYPCIWEDDLELDVPTKVTIFDVDYVVSKTPSGEAIAMKDHCTHKGAALSEGRMTANGHFQCAYHGWSFDGKSGDCVEIPQIIREHDGTKRSATIPSKACTNAVPAQIHQGLVWLFPGGGLEKALLAPPPPSVPDKFASMKRSTVVRDMPVDFSILLSNICDPDHGLFAHQSTSFDMYTASLDCGFDTFVSEETDGGKGWSFRTQIDAKDKMLVVDQSLRDKLHPKKKKSAKPKPKDTEELWATFQFYAPTHVRLNRVNKKTGEVKFVSIFYVCPVGVGRSRLMSGSLAGFSLPRWLLHLNFANFLDQDTYLLATQQGKLLAQEADDLRAAMKQEGIDRDDTEKVKGLKLRTRTKSFVLPSPTDKIGAKLERFWDVTLARCPNRVRHLLKLDESGALLRTPSREFVLDRKTQNLDISKDSRGTVRNCRNTKRVSRVLSIALILGKVACVTYRPSGLVNSFFKTSFLVSAVAGLSVASSLAGKLENEYYFKYTDDHRRADMKKIPEKIWLDN